MSVSLNEGKPGIAMVIDAIILIELPGSEPAKCHCHTFFYSATKDKMPSQYVPLMRSNASYSLHAHKHDCLMNVLKSSQRILGQVTILSRQISAIALGPACRTVPVPNSFVARKNFEGLGPNLGAERLCSRQSAAAVWMEQDSMATPTSRVRPAFHSCNWTT